MKIGSIGASTVAQTIAKHVPPFGHQVMLSNSRGPDSLAALVKELGTGATAGTGERGIFLRHCPPARARSRHLKVGAYYRKPCGNA